jgi:hypothetical protein
MTLSEWLTRELITAEDRLERYGDTPEARGYWIGYANAITNALNELEGMSE